MKGWKPPNGFIDDPFPANPKWKVKDNLVDPSALHDLPKIDIPKIEPVKIDPINLQLPKIEMPRIEPQHFTTPIGRDPILRQDWTVRPGGLGVGYDPHFPPVVTPPEIDLPGRLGGMRQHWTREDWSMRSPSQRQGIGIPEWRWSDSLHTRWGNIPKKESSDLGLAGTILALLVVACIVFLMVIGVMAAIDWAVGAAGSLLRDLQMGLQNILSGF